MSTTSFTIGQSSERRIGEDYFDWAIWIEGDKTTLQTIKKVTYYLHDTFPDPVRVKWKATTKFKLKTSGWGTFMIYIHILLKDGQEVEQSHYLILEEDYDSTKITKELLESREGRNKKNKKTVFISTSSMDREIAHKIQKILEANDVNVVKAEDMPLGSTFDDFINDSIKSASTVIAIKSEYENSWQDQELELAKNEQIPIRVINAEVKHKIKNISGELDGLGGALFKNILKDGFD